MGFQSFFILLPAGWIPYGVQFQDGVCDSYFPENMNHKRDRFCICYRIAAADNFKSKLMELSLPSPLGSFGPEHGADVVELLGAATLRSEERRVGKGCESGCGREVWRRKATG